MTSDTTQVTTTTYLAPVDAERLRQLAKTEDRSIAAEVRVAIRRHLEAHEASSAEQIPALISH